MASDGEPRFVITIVRRINNPNYAAELKAQEENNYRFRNYVNDTYPVPSPMVDQNVLTTEITEEQWKKIQKLVLENW